MPEPTEQTTTTTTTTSTLSGILSGLLTSGTELASAALVAVGRSVDAGYSIAGDVLQTGADGVASIAGYGDKGPKPPGAKALVKRAEQVNTARRLLKHKEEGAPDWEAKWSALPADVREQVVAEAPFRGRRQDLKQEYDERLARWEEQGGQGERPLEPLFVKLAVGGSGDAAWRTHCDVDGILIDEELAKSKSRLGDDRTTLYTKSEFDVDYAGPGGPGSAESVLGQMAAGGKEWVSSFANSGPNSVDNIARTAGSQIAEKILGLHHEGQPIVFLVKGHSRGGVVANRLAEFLQGAFPDASVELASFDPVPGLFEPERNHEIDVSGVDESTVVYSVFSGHDIVAGFTPQRVFGAKRIIITEQDHGAGVRSGVTLGGKMYRGSRLNSLPPGVYRDMNADPSKAGELIPVCDVDEVKNAFMTVYTARYKAGLLKQAHKAGRNWDYNRKENIEAVLEEVLAHLPAADWTATLAQTLDKLASDGTPS